MNKEIEEKRIKNKSLRYCSVFYDMLVEYGIDDIEAWYMDYIVNTSKTAGHAGWSRAKPETIGKALGLSIRLIYKLREGLIKKGLLEIKGEYTRVIVEWKKKKIPGVRGFTKYDHLARQELKLSQIEYRFLWFGWKLQEKEWWTLPANSNHVIVYTPKKLVEEFNITRLTVASMMKKLKERGFIDYGKARTGEKYIEVLIDMDKAGDYTYINVFGMNEYLVTKEEASKFITPPPPPPPVKYVN